MLPSLKNMVAAARLLRAEVAAGAQPGTPREPVAAAASEKEAAVPEPPRKAAGCNGACACRG